MQKFTNPNEETGVPAKKFRPRKVPRYLPGSVDYSTLKNDLKTYNAHLYACFTAVTKTDTTPPPFHIKSYFKPFNLTADIFTVRQLDIQNKKLVQRINSINRSKGIIDSFNPHAYVKLSNWPVQKWKFIQIDKENKKLYRRLVAVTSSYSREEHLKDWKKIVEKLESGSKYPVAIFKKKTKDEEMREYPSISNLMYLSVIEDRPKVFLEFKIDNGLVLGKIIIELYTDIVPIAVDNFLTICKGNNYLTYKNCPVHKIYKNTFCVMGDITKFNGKGGLSIYGDTFSVENYTLKHKRPGVVSMYSVDCDQVNSQFLITFNAIPELDNKMMVVGKIIQGAKNLYKINDLGTMYGRPVTKIIISDCGEAIKKQK